MNERQAQLAATLLRRRRGWIEDEATIRLTEDEVREFFIMLSSVEDAMKVPDDSEQEREPKRDFIGMGDADGYKS